MSWDSEIPVLLRNYVGDIDSTNYKYTDDQLQQLILSSAQFVIVDIPTKQTYSSNIENVTLKPDPTNRATTDTRDDPFINLVVIKGAWMIANGEIRIYGSQNISIRDGTSEVNLKRDLRSLSDILDKYSKAYDEYKDRYIRESMFGYMGSAITSPIALFDGHGGYSFHSGTRYDRW